MADIDVEAIEGACRLAGLVPVQIEVEVPGDTLTVRSWVSPGFLQDDEMLAETLAAKAPAIAKEMRGYFGGGS
ncbi:hypothetical protein [Mycobacterium intracellulare]|uniref:Uncharacterized protein n=1 Tax=Mycobacterium intracellulare TaxID=1767 RepID=A0AAE4UBL0_MYCIT|nr:hypothetical protein [Mycobacterium intracellulare]MDV6975276.1 hypothetical protein [Mycobacterium intracellulare]MDV6980340.1 hypothetical protein [Mycobacterium intracellulare]MDV7010769.1 hypothetical protein [Mycobacterium intracellulare]MDV7025675.1 hypothetical protein [Mycobacterium intracellulare]